MGIISNTRQRFLRLFQNSENVEFPTGDVQFIPYPQLWAYYEQNGLYDSLMSANYYLEQWHESMKPIRNPANRSVEFFASKLMPGVLPNSVEIITPNPKIIDPIHQIWLWSNLNSKKTVAGRWLSVYGDLFIHPTANSTNTQVYLQFLKPEKVTEWREDDRGYVTYIRIDVSMDNGMTHTETWDYEFHKVWEHSMGTEVPIQSLGVGVATPISEYGIDFVPFIHAKFRDTGHHRGMGAFTHCLDKIDEANRMATRLHEIMFRFNKPHWAVSANDVDDSGRPMPPPSLTPTTTSRNTGGTATEVSDETLFRLPGRSTITSLIPDLKYGDYLLLLQDMMVEIEKDLPELAFPDLRKLGGNISGVAVRMLLGDAVDRAIEARANWESGMIRAENMALSMGTYLSIWSGIGSYDAGDFEHSYMERPMFADEIPAPLPTV